MRTDLKTGDEAGRLRALRRLEVLDTPPEAPFDNIVNLVRVVLGVPICVVSLIDEDRQWFKARSGLAVCQTSRDVAFCAHTIQQAVPFIVRDALKDARFATNPLVTGPPFIRAYAGIPLRTPEGYNAGSLCIIDGVTRDFSDRELAVLGSFARLAENELALRRTGALDRLTGAMSRQCWTERAEAEIARAQRDAGTLSLAVLDLDNFKCVNAALGHEAGDTVIRHAADICMAALRPSDVFGRLGGAEFGLMMPGTDSGAAIAAAERMRGLFGQGPGALARPVNCTVSIGVSQLDGADPGLAPLLARADKALAEAKAAGRDRCVLHAGPGIAGR
jgi:diguanylate cyclase (GGDEF)-like protein